MVHAHAFGMNVRFAAVSGMIEMFVLSPCGSGAPNRWPSTVRIERGWLRLDQSLRCWAGAGFGVMGTVSAWAEVVRLQSERELLRAEVAQLCPLVVELRASFGRMKDLIE